MSEQRPLIAAPAIFEFVGQKSGGKTHLATLVADMLVVNEFSFTAFQIDDQKRLGHMIGDVVDLRPDPDRLIEDPTLLMRALAPLHEAARVAGQNRTSILLDTGANEVENLGNFLHDVGFDEDANDWKLPIVAFAPFLPEDSESTRQATFTINRISAALPHANIVLVENRYGGSSDRIVSGSLAEQNHRELLRAAKGLDKIIMPAIPREYWAPFEGAGIRFLKALAMDPVEASGQLGRSIAEIKIAKSAIARFWRSMHEQLSQIIDLPKGGR